MEAQINRKNVLDYLKITQADDATMLTIDKLEKELLALCSIKKSVKICDTKIVDGYYALEGTDITLDSNDINALFTKTDKIAMFALSLGIEVDKKILYYSKTSITQMIILDALASCYIEELCEELNENINTTMQNKHHTVRFSAGYGDLNINKQKQIVDTLGGYKKLGITVGASSMMLPQKSITAFVGYSDFPQKSDYKCAQCALQKCDPICAKRKKNA
ncbi:MAG: vitamin B12 dependent-methionine synthase activation domain-containing protein [Bacillota bacterium]